MKSGGKGRGAESEGRGARVRGLCAWVAACLLLLPLAARAQAGATVTILHFNDVYEITPVEAGKAGGLARVARFRAELKARHPELLTTFAGDYLSPSALGTARVNGERLAGRQMVAVLNQVGIDWATFGNHEFDVTEAGLRARLAESKFRLVSSNVTDASGALFPNTVKDVVIRVKTPSGVVRIGLLGLTIDMNKQPWVRYAPPVESARAAVADLKGKCDVIVALTHLALATDQEVAEQLPEIDLILGGHEHENWVIERGEHFTPIVKADSNVRTVAIVTLRVPTRKGLHPVITARIQRIDDSMKEGPRTAAEVRKWTELGFAGFRNEGFEPGQIVTKTDVPLDGREASVRNRPTNLAELITDAMRHDAGTELAIVNGGSIRIDDVLPPGPVTQYDVIRVLPFGGKTVKATFTGALLSRVLQIGEQNRGSGGFLHYAGPKTIDPAGRYTLAISDFLLTGGEANLGFLTRQNPEITGITDLRDVRMELIDELKRRFGPR
jgi:5'-nucleotidase/UDP-sugar diphosphatase